MKINFAVIGTNKITDRFLEAAQTIEDFQLKGVYSRSMEKALSYAKKHGAQLAFDSLDELARCSEVDAVYIASPNSLHASQSVRMLENGRHVLCEKPIASNLKEFMEMRSAAEKHKKVLLEAMRSVYSPGFAAVRDHLYRLGTVRRVSFQYCQYSSRYDHYKEWIVENAFNPALSNGALMDIGVYCVHPAVALFGKPRSVKSSSLKLSNGVDGAGTVLLEYEGMQGELVYSKISDSRIPSQIQGEEGTMVIEEIPDPQTVTVYDRRGGKEILDIPKTDNNMVYEIREFIRLIKENEYEHPYLLNSQMTMELMDEVRRQQKILFPADGSACGKEEENGK